MRVDVDEPGRHDEARDVQGLACGRPRKRFDRHDPAVADTDVGRERRRTGAVDDPAAREEEIERRAGEHREAGPVAERRLHGDRAARLEEPASRNRPRVREEVLRGHAIGYGAGPAVAKREGVAGQPGGAGGETDYIAVR